MSVGNQDSIEALYDAHVKKYVTENDKLAKRLYPHLKICIHSNDETGIRSILSKCPKTATFVKGEEIAYIKNVDIAQELIEKGAKIDLSSRDGLTLLDATFMSYYNSHRDDDKKLFDYLYKNFAKSFNPKRIIRFALQYNVQKMIKILFNMNLSVKVIVPYKTDVTIYSEDKEKIDAFISFFHTLDLKTKFYNSSIASLPSSLEIQCTVEEVYERMVNYIRQSHNPELIAKCQDKFTNLNNFKFHIEAPLENMDTHLPAFDMKVTPSGKSVRSYPPVLAAVLPLKKVTGPRVLAALENMPDKYKYKVALEFSIWAHNRAFNSGDMKRIHEMGGYHRGNKQKRG